MKTNSQLSDGASGTTVNVEFSHGIGLYIAMECFREINQPDCAKLFSTSKDVKQMSCAKVTHQYEFRKILNTIFESGNDLLSL